MSWRIIITGAIFLLLAVLLAICGIALKDKFPLLPVMVIGANVVVILTGWKTILDMVQTTKSLRKLESDLEKQGLEIEKLRLEIADKKKTAQKKDAYVEVATFAHVTKYSAQIRNVAPPIVALLTAVILYGVSNRLGEWEPVLESKAQVAAEKTQLAQQQKDIKKAKQETQMAQAANEQTKKASEEIKKTYALRTVQQQKDVEKARRQTIGALEALSNKKRNNNEHAEGVKRGGIRADISVGGGGLVGGGGQSEFDSHSATGTKRRLSRLYAQTGETDYARGDLSEALRNYNEAIQMWHGSAEAYAGRGETLSALGNWNEALRDYNEAIRLEQDYAQAYLGRGVARYAQGDLSGALSDYNEAIRLKPDYAYAFFKRSIVHRAQGDSSGAQQDYDRAIRLGYKPTGG